MKGEKEVAKYYGINPKTVHRWVTQGLKKNYGKLLFHLIFFIGGGRKVRQPEMDKKLLKWFYFYHIVQGNKVTAKDFKKKALELSNDSTFRASKGWFQKFRKRYNIQF